MMITVKTAITGNTAIMIPDDAVNTTTTRLIVVVGPGDIVAVDCGEAVFAIHIIRL